MGEETGIFDRSWVAHRNAAVTRPKEIGQTSGNGNWGNFLDEHGLITGFSCAQDFFVHISL
jgi:hypothetical protein